MLEDIELTLSHVNLGGLTEFATLALFGTAQAHRVTEGLNISIRDITDAEDRVLYPGYFMTHLRVPPGHRLSRYRVWDRVTVGIDARSFGKMVLETRYVLGPRGEIGSPETWDLERYPSMYAGTMFVVDGHAGEPRPAVPRADRVAALPKLTAPPPSLARFAEVQGRGVVDPGLPRALETREPIRYELVAGRDITAGRELMFTSFSHVMDIAEAMFLGGDAWPPFSRELLDCASVLEREVFYFANCSAGDVILATLGGELTACSPDFHGEARDVVSGGIYTLDIELYQERTGALLAAAKVKKLLAIPSSRRALLREAERLVLRHRGAPRLEPAITTPPPPAVVARPTETGVLAEVRAAVAEALERDAGSIPLDVKLGELGMDSLRVVDLVHALEARRGRPIDPSIVVEHPTVQALARYLEAEGPGVEGAERTADGRIHAFTRVRAPIDRSAAFWTAILSAASGHPVVLREIAFAAPLEGDTRVTIWIEPDGRFRVESDACHVRGEIGRGSKLDGVAA